MSVGDRELFPMSESSLSSFDSRTHISSLSSDAFFFRSAGGKLAFLASGDTSDVQISYSSSVTALQAEFKVRRERKEKEDASDSQTEPLRFRSSLCSLRPPLSWLVTLASSLLTSLPLVTRMGRL